VERGIFHDTNYASALRLFYSFLFFLSVYETPHTFGLASHNLYPQNIRRARTARPTSYGLAIVPWDPLYNQTRRGATHRKTLPHPPIVSRRITAAALIATPLRKQPRIAQTTQRNRNHTQTKSTNLHMFRSPSSPAPHHPLLNAVTTTCTSAPPPARNNLWPPVPAASQTTHLAWRGRLHARALRHATVSHLTLVRRPLPLPTRTSGAAPLTAKPYAQVTQQHSNGSR